MTRSIRSNPAVRLVGVVLITGALAACGGLRETIGIDSDPPDEFQVVVRAPLSMPADYGLRAPRPGAPRPQEETIRDRTRQIVLDAQGKAQVRKVRPEDIKGVTPAEAVLLSKVGAEDVDPNIRQAVDRETASLEAENRTFVESLLFWKEYEVPDRVVDATAERRRLQENAALGRSADAGTTPEIERKKSKSLLQTLF